MRSLAILAVVVSFAGASAQAAEKNPKSIDLKTLPPAFQATVQANLNSAEIKNIDKEKEDGTEQYEIETILNGHARDFNVDTKGRLLVIEEATTLDALPAAAKAGILKKVAAGKVTMVETFVKTGQPTMYEAAYTDKSGKKHEVLVKADGAATKE